MSSKQSFSIFSRALKKSINDSKGLKLTARGNKPEKNNFS